MQFTNGHLAIVKADKKNDGFEFVILGHNDKIVFGQHIDGRGRVEVPVALVSSVSSEVKLAKITKQKLEALAKEPVVLPTVKAPKVVGAGTKLEQALELAKTSSGLSRKEFIALLVDKLGMTPAGASTYCAKVRSMNLATKTSIRVVE